MVNVDRISDLHDSVLSHILSFLSTKQAVTTSVLSTRWRYLFGLLSNLDFDLDEFRPRHEFMLDNYTVKRFRCFVDKIMFSLDTKKVDKFRLRCDERIGTIRWISAAVEHGVKHLDLILPLGMFTLSDELKKKKRFTLLPGVLFPCRTLVTLKLNTHKFDESNVPYDVCLPNLKTLHLIEFLNDDSFKHLVSSCISLEDLVLDKCKMKKINISHNLLKRLTILHSSRVCSSVVIDTPALSYFKYTDYVAGEYSLKNLESLVEADVHFIERGSNNREAEASFFEGINNVQSLSLSFISSKVFANLRQFLPPCILFKLKMIRIVLFKVDEDFFRQAKYVLENARVRKKFAIHTSMSSSISQSKECCCIVVD